MSPRGAPWGWRGGWCPAPVRPLKPPPCSPACFSVLPDTTACRRQSKTHRGPNDRAAAGDSVSDSAWPRLGPHFLQRCRLRLPRGAGRGVALGPSLGWEGAGKGRGTQRMCGSVCLPGRGAGSPALPLTSSPKWGQELPRPHPRGRGRSRGGAGCMLGAQRSGLAGLACAGWTPQTRPPRGSCSPLAATRPEAPRARGFPGWGAVPRRAPPLLFPETPTGKLSHRQPPSPGP